MKASYIIALFAAVAVANAWEPGTHTEDSKVQVQKASGTQSEVSNNGGGLVSANNLAHDGVNVLSSDKQFANVEQGQRQ